MAPLTDFGLVFRVSHPRSGPNSSLGIEGIVGFNRISLWLCVFISMFGRRIGFGDDKVIMIKFPWLLIQSLVILLVKRIKSKNLEKINLLIPLFSLFFTLAISRYC